MTQAYFVYKITNILNGKNYVGVSNDPARRWREHRYTARHEPEFPIHYAMQKYGVDSFEMEVIFGSKDRFFIFNEMESYFIEKYDAQKNGYNCTSGGEGSPNISEEAKRQKSEFALKQHSNKKFKLKHVVATSKANQNPEKRKQIASAAKARWADPTFQIKMRAKYQTKEQVEKRYKASLGKRAIDWQIIDPTGQKHAVHNLKQWCEERGFNHKTFRQAAYQNTKTNGGYSISKLSK